MPKQSELPHASPTPDAGNLRIPDFAGTKPAPLGRLGFGLRVPDAWNATRLLEGDLAQLADVEFADPSFLAAAEDASANGAVFFAAGTDEDGRTAAIEVRPATEGEPIPTSTESEPGASVDSADRSAFVSELRLPDSGPLWRVTITAEDQTTHASLLEMVKATFVVG